MANSQTTTERHSLFHRSKILLVSAFSTAASTSPRGAIKGKTPLSTIQAEIEQRAPRYSKDDEYEAVTTLKLERGTQGEVLVKKSLRSGNVFVVKHTKYNRATVDNRTILDGDRNHKVPTEAVIVKDLLKPHPNVVVVHDFFMNKNAPGRYFIYMDACNGGDLHEQICHWHLRKQIVPKVFLYHLIVQVSDVFAFLHHGLRHSTGSCYTQDEDHEAVVHGDIKLENFFLNWSSRNIGGLPDIVIGDFGHAKLLSDPEPRVDCGTEGWNSPTVTARYKKCVVKELDFRLTRSEKLKIYYDIGKQRNLSDDVYSLGLVFATAANDAPTRVYPSWPVGQDEEVLSLSRENYLRDIVYGCLRVDPEKRVSMSFGEKGILGEVNRMRSARDRLLAQGVKIDPTDWFRIPTPTSTASTK
ncbi:hypothetical protein CB0940_09019 [Cercospora beticola]|uniref:non-specific serine/threonine protein kinase n=1 Tax=Cercospora beticola TaxID=122368 RepID=A0A2G5HHV8_CERBT|nr:hypothetical protein CB0940_09019 [Cercospora beticola]PIA92128.1 hypothetical protein CB0940_09019 [Cercospora beticola]WPB06708.1 hypothetical protein RHO25_011367 [Cercospora beticola]